MPGGDRTGPMGMGPMTGRAAGYCASYSTPNNTRPIYGRGKFSYGCGRGRGLGRGLGFRRAAHTYGNSSYGDPYFAVLPYGSEPNSQQEVKMLKDQARAMQEEISAINGRIKELEADKS